MATGTLDFVVEEEDVQVLFLVVELEKTEYLVTLAVLGKAEVGAASLVELSLCANPTA